MPLCEKVNNKAHCPKIKKIKKTFKPERNIYGEEGGRGLRSNKALRSDPD